jgi:hypothetical protein
MYYRFIFSILILFVIPNAVAWGEEKYCHPFSESKCKKGDVIITFNFKQALQLCDFSENMVTVSADNKALCKYIGYKRQNR